MKRSLLVAISLTTSLLLLYASAIAQTERALRGATHNSSSHATAFSHGIARQPPPPAQCPFNVPVVSLPAGSGALGFQWSAAILPLGDPCVDGIVVDPTDEKTWYVAAVKGLYVTHNGGLTWTHPLTEQVNTESIMLSPVHPNILFVGSGQTIYRSGDKGQFWRPMHKFAQTIMSVYVASDSKLYVGVSWAGSQLPNGIFISPNIGIDWKFSSFGAGHKNLICWDIERDPKDGTLYVGTEISDHLPQPYHPPFFRSQDDGLTWKNVAGTLPWHVIAAQVRPADHYVYALTEGAGLYGSANHADTWIPPGPGEAPSSSLLMDSKLPKRLFGGRQKFNLVNGGAFVSINAGNTFKPIGLQGVTVAGLSLNGNSTRLFAAAYASGIYVSTVPPMIVPN